MVHNFYEFIAEKSKNDPIPELSRNKDKFGIIIMGSPGAGKSTFINRFIRPRNPNLKSFSTDDVSTRFTKDPNKFHQGSAELNIRRLKSFIANGKPFIYDTTGAHAEQVFDISELAHEQGYKIVFIHMITDIETAKKQNLQRDRKVDDDYLEYAHKEQFKNMSRFNREIQPEKYYVVLNINNKYKFLQYRNGHLLKRKVDKYVPIKKTRNETT